jgi:plasmid stability protein
MEPNSMAVNLSIKNVPDDVVEALRQRAERNHRSLQGELLHIVEQAARLTSPLSPLELLAEVRKRGIRTRGRAATLIRKDRDSR